MCLILQRMIEDDAVVKVFVVKIVVFITNIAFIEEKLFLDVDESDRGHGEISPQNGFHHVFGRGFGFPLLFLLLGLFTL